MKVLVIGASGATGRLVVKQLLEQHIETKIVIRETASFPEDMREDRIIEIVKGNIDEFSTQRMRDLISDCNAVVCCLGHNINVKGMFGKPRLLVYNAVKKVTEVLKTTKEKKKFILMSTTAYTHRKGEEKDTLGEKIIFRLLHVLLPPHRDNVLSGNLLAETMWDSDAFEWVAVRPDSLFDEEEKSAYQICAQKLRSPIFNAGKTSRVNVAHFMVNLLVHNSLWQSWVFKMPVIYNIV